MALLPSDSSMKIPHASRPAPILGILLIDDNKHGLAARKSVLEDAGYSVTACAVPEDAVEHFAATLYHLVVTDYRMPNMNGVELIGKLREIRPAVPIVLLSGLVEVLGLNEQNTGADIVIAKTSTEVTHLVRAVNKLLNAPPARKPVRSHVRSQTAKTV